MGDFSWEDDGTLPQNKHKPFKTFKDASLFKKKTY